MFSVFLPSRTRSKIWTNVIGLREWNVQDWKNGGKKKKKKNKMHQLNEQVSKFVAVEILG